MQFYKIKRGNYIYLIATGILLLNFSISKVYAIDTISFTGSTTYSASLTNFQKVKINANTRLTLNNNYAFTYGVSLVGYNSSLIISAGKTLTANVTGDNNLNILNIAGTLTGNVNLGAGDDKLKFNNSSSSISGIINGGDGFDTISFIGGKTFNNTLTGFENFIVNENTNVILDNGYIFTSGVNLVGNNSNLTISTGRTLTADVIGDANSNILNVVGTLTGNVDLGAGDDILNFNNDLSSISGTIDGGDGNDIISFNGCYKVLDNTLTGFEKMVLNSANVSLNNDYAFSSGIALNGNSSILEIAEGKTVTANITTDNGSNHIIDIQGTLFGNITFGNGYGALGINATSLANIGTITNADTIQVYGDGAINGDKFINNGIIGLNTLGFFDGKQTLTGTYVTNFIYNIGNNLTVESGTRIKANMFVNDPNSTLRFKNGVILVINNMTNYGKVRFDHQQILHGDFANADYTNEYGNNVTGNLIFGLTNTADFGSLHATGDVDVNNGHITLELNSGYVIQNGDVFQLIKADGTLSGVNLDNITKNTKFINFDSIFDSINNTLMVKATRTTTYTDIADTANKKTTADALQGFINNSPNANITRILNVLDSQTTVEGVNNLLSDLQPNSTKAIEMTSASIQDRIFDAIQQRQDFYKLAKTDYSNVRYALNDLIQTDVSSYSDATDKDGWMQLIYKKANQKNTYDTIGYKLDTTGFITGYDYKFNDKYRAGVSLSYTTTTIDGNNNSYNGDVDSIQLNTYGTYTLGSLYFDGVLGYAINDYNSNRNITALGETALSDFKGQQLGIKATIGYLKKYGNWSVNPNTSLQYTYLNTDGYTESGSAANLSVDKSNYDSVKLGVGTSIDYNIVRRPYSYTLIPSINFHYSREMKQNSIDTTSRFENTSTYFTTVWNKIPKDLFKIGTSLNYFNKTRDINLSGGYDLELRKDYIGNSLKLQAKYYF